MYQMCLFPGGLALQDGQLTFQLRMALQRVARLRNQHLLAAEQAD